jgi:TonB family protein
MGLPAKKLIELLIEHDPASPKFREGVRESLGPQLAHPQVIAEDDLGLWKDVFVEQKLPWGKFLQSIVLHAAAFGLIWVLTLTWLRQQKILAPAPFDRSSLITYAPEEYLPPLDTGTTETPKAQAGDPVFAKQPILSVPREPDNRSQTIVVPPNLKVDHDVPLPNIVATGSVAPIVPIDAVRSLSSRVNSPDTQVVAPAPDADFTHDRTNRTALKSDIIPPPAEVKTDRTRALAAPEAAIVEPPPEVATAKGRVGLLNIGPAQVVAPAPQLTLAEQHTLGARNKGTGKGGGANGLPGVGDAVAPPPTVAAGGHGSAQGRMIALGINPVVATGPVAVPSGNRRGAFEANPHGKPGASGTPTIAGSKSANGTGAKGHNNGSLPSGLRVDAANGRTGAIERNGSSANGDGTGDGRDTASRSSSGAPSGTGSRTGQRTPATVSDDKVTELDRQVFGDRHFYAMTQNMPNLNSSTGSWVIRFAELQPEQKQGALLAPVATEQSDPGYPLELIRTNVHGFVTLYAVIRPDGQVGNIRVLSSPDDRLDAYAAKALARWKFLPAEKDGKPVAIEAVVVIPFRVHKAF